ncbi:MAG: hypothetical protein DRP42_00575 [Tenericutes bacterium]|nr:MAG: hypothetical protein DRP42_00575 [Mycoplasmatota bacterium]
MSSFFKAGGEEAQAEGQLDREGLDAATKALDEVGLNAPYKGHADHGVVSVKYATELVGNWQIDHGVDGDNYMVQMIPRKEIHANPTDVVKAIITILSDIVPDDVQVYITPPNPKFDIAFYTIKLEAIMKKPGAETIVQRRVPTELGGINAWAA